MIGKKQHGSESSADRAKLILDTGSVKCSIQIVFKRHSNNNYIVLWHKKMTWEHWVKSWTLCVIVKTLDKTLLCGFSCLVLPWDKRRERGENHLAKDLDGAFLRLCLFLSQLVAVGIAHWKNWSGFTLYLHALHWLYLSADGRCVDESIAQKQSDGWCVQHGKWKLHAGNTVDGEWILNQSSHTFLLQKEVE